MPKSVPSFVFFIQEAIRNSRMLPDLKQAGKKTVPNASTKSRPGRRVPECTGKIWFPGNGMADTSTIMYYGASTVGVDAPQFESFYTVPLKKLVTTALLFHSFFCGSLK